VIGCGVFPIDAEWTSSSIEVGCVVLVAYGVVEGGEEQCYEVEIIVRAQVFRHNSLLLALGSVVCVDVGVVGRHLERYPVRCLLAVFRRGATDADPVAIVIVLHYIADVVVGVAFEVSVGAVVDFVSGYQIECLEAWKLLDFKLYGGDAVAGFFHGVEQCTYTFYVYTFFLGICGKILEGHRVEFCNGLVEVCHSDRTGERVGFVEHCTYCRLEGGIFPVVGK